MLEVLEVVVLDKLAILGQLEILELLILEVAAEVLVIQQLVGLVVLE